jgi:uncharacterized SAM-binding protein YcdF (DUF218 family)
MRSNIPKKRKYPKIPLIKRQEMWTLTLQGWVIAIALVAAFMFFGLMNLYSFLAVTSPITADVLVVEGWVTDYALKQAFTEFESGSYGQVITTGIPVERGFYLSEYKDYAAIAAATLEKMGVPKEKLAIVPTPGVIKNRTQAAAVTLQEWIANSNNQIDSVNLFSSDAHARRSWMTFKKILSPQIKVGIIAAQPTGYDSNKWWGSSEGVRVVIAEAIAFVYALLAG